MIEYEKIFKFLMVSHKMSNFIKPGELYNTMARAAHGAEDAPEIPPEDVEKAKRLQSLLGLNDPNQAVVMLREVDRCVASGAEFPYDGWLPEIQEDTRDRLIGYIARAGKED